MCALHIHSSAKVLRAFSNPYSDRLVKSFAAKFHLSSWLVKSPSHRKSLWAVVFGNVLGVELKYVHIIPCNNVTLPFGPSLVSI